MNVYLAELIISNHSQLWPGQPGLAPFGFAVVVFSSLRVLTKLTVIVISCTNCLLLIRAMVSMGSAGQLLRGIQQNPPRGRGWTGSLGLTAQPGTAGKGQEEKIPPGLLPKNTSRACFARRGAARAALGAVLPCRALQELLQCSPQCPAPPAPHQGTCAGPGVAAPPGMCFSLGLFCWFSPKVQAAKEADASWHSRSDFIPVAAVCAAGW